MTDLVFVSNDELEHYGVKGMKWGTRKRKETSKASEALKDARRDRKDLKRMSKKKSGATRADKKAQRDRIKDRMKNDPDYKKAIDDLNAWDSAKTGVYLDRALGGAMAAPVIFAMLKEVPYAKIAQGASQLGAAAANTKFAKAKIRYNPKSPFWDGVNVSGSVVQTSMELVRRYS